MYNFLLRPGYGSQKLLIEFSIESDDEIYIEVLLNAISSISPKVAKIEDLWMNDETLLHLSSTNGSFIISRDIWGFVFIMSDTNQPVISEISELLEKDTYFEKKEVDYEKYRHLKS